MEKQKITCLAQLGEILYRENYPRTVYLGTELFRRFYQNAIAPSARDFHAEHKRPFFIYDGCVILPKTWPSDAERPAELDLSDRLEWFA